MGCTRPILIPNKNYNKGKNLRRREHERFFRVPCGQCVNCRTQKRNNLENMLKLELMNYNGMACFGTLTYTDEFLQQNGRTVYQDIQNIPYTACKKDFQLFMKRLRVNLERKGYKQKLKYVFCTEYGDVGHRCHIHFVIMGINGNCRGEIQKAWRSKYTINGITKKYPIGQIQCDDLQVGGLRYVIKYMDYAPVGTEQKRVWEENGIEAPCVKHSGGLGQKQIVEQLNKGEMVNGYFKTREGMKEQRLGRYYLNKYGITDEPKPYKLETRYEMEAKGWKCKPANTIEFLEQLDMYQDAKSKAEEGERLQRLKSQGIDINIYENKLNNTISKENHTIFNSSKIVESLLKGQSKEDK